MITFTFNSVAERKPEHGQEIIYLKHRSRFEFYLIASGLNYENT